MKALMNLKISFLLIFHLQMIVPIVLI